MAASTAFAIVVLAILGAVMGPQWDPVPLTDALEVETSSTAILGVPELEQYPVRTSVVTVQLDGTSVQAQVSEPVGLDEPAPAVVFLHGAGTGTYDVAFTKQAHALAAAGVVAMVPDKRLDTYTTRHRDYVAMASDYQRSVDLLRDRPGVDPDRVGIYGESEGAWVAPVMAAEDPRIAFVVLVSAPVVPPREQAAFAADSYLRNTGVPEDVFRAIPRAVGMAIPGGGFEYADFDVTPYQRRIHVPVLMVYGTGDASMPVVQGAEQVIRDTAIAGNGDVTVRYYEGASHGIKVAGVIVPEFLVDMTRWVVGLPTSVVASPRIAGDQPTQAYVAEPVPQPQWIGDGDLLIAVVVGSVAAIVLGGLVAASARTADAVGRRWDVRAGLPPRTRPRFARGVAATTVAVGVGALATVVALLVYLVAIARLALDYERNAWVVTGGWALVRLLGVGVVVAGVLLARRLRAARAVGQPVAPDGLRRAVLWLVGAGSAVLLVVLAYWGVFQLGI